MPGAAAQFAALILDVRDEAHASLALGAAAVEAFDVARLQQGVFLHKQALQGGEVRVLLGHQGGESFADLRGIVG